MIINDIFGNPVFDFDKSFYSFNRDEKDMNPCSFIEKDGKTILVHNVLGINKEDLKVTQKRENHFNYIYVQGTTKDETTGKEYNINSRIKLKQDDIKNISSNCKNGLLYIIVEYDKAQIDTKQIQID